MLDAGSNFLDSMFKVNAEQMPFVWSTVRETIPESRWTCEAVLNRSSS